MPPRGPRRALPAAATAAVAALAVAASMVALSPLVSAAQPRGYGPSAPFDDALMGDTGPVEPMKNKAKIVRTKHGYRLTAGQQHSRLTVDLVKGRLRFHDVGTRSWKSLPRSCKSKRARGVKALCAVPAGTTRSRPMLVEIHPRLGNDHVDGRTLPAAFEMAVLADAGRDIVRTGAGKDFVNGARHRDRIYTGAGRDWIRGGRGNDLLRGRAGNDYIVGQQGRDSIRGGRGKDRIYQ
jgi:serralysin